MTPGPLNDFCSVLGWVFGIHWNSCLLGGFLYALHFFCVVTFVSGWLLLETCSFSVYSCVLFFVNPCVLTLPTCVSTWAD